MSITKRKSDANVLSSLIETSLAQDKLSGLSNIIGIIASSIDAPIAILWQVAPPPESESLFILAEWFKEPVNIPTYFHRLKKNKAITTWKAISENEPQAKYNLTKNDSEFFGEFGVQSLLSIPLKTKKSIYALNFYWTTENKLTKKESDKSIKKAQFLANSLLGFYQSLTEKVSYSLLGNSSELLSQLNNQETNSDYQYITEKICSLISETLQAQEVSLYLSEVPDSNDPIFKLQATTWTNANIVTERRLNQDDSLTGWALTNQKNIMIFDLSTYDSCKKQYEEYYPNLDRATEKEKSREKSIRLVLKISDKYNLPPLSFIAIPIIYAGKTLGVIRCCAAKKAPYYFSEQKLHLLGLVANQIAPAWDNWLNRRKMIEENKSLHSFVNSLAKLNNLVLDRTRKNNKIHKEGFLENLQGEIFTESLSSVHEINNVEVSAIRLVNKEKNHLYFASLHGKVKVDMPTDTFDLDDNDESGEPIKAGVWVVKHGKTLVIKNSNDRYGHVLTRFKSKSMIISPIKLGDEVIGVIDVRNPTEELFAPYTQPIVELIGMQLGLYSYLIDAVLTLKAEKQQQTQTYEDFGHQLKSPMNQLRARACGCVDDYSDLTHVPKQLLYLKGLSAKALRVTQAIRLFAELSKDNSIILDKTRLTEDALTKILIEGGMDQENTIDPSNNLKFQVNKINSDSLKRAKLFVDTDLLIQAISNLLDNAAKYSFPNTVIEMDFGLTGKKNFHITIKNKGLVLDEAEVCKQRNWRGKDAKAVVGEGSGIGLWIVDNIMKAHNGDLIIVTTKKQITEVKLIFPAIMLY